MQASRRGRDQKQAVQLRTLQGVTGGEVSMQTWLRPPSTTVFPSFGLTWSLMLHFGWDDHGRFKRGEAVMYVNTLEISKSAERYGLNTRSEKQEPMTYLRYIPAYSFCVVFCFFLHLY